MTVIDQAPPRAQPPPGLKRWWRRLSSDRGLTWTAVFIIVVACSVRAWWVGHSWLLLDDFYFTSEIARGIDNADWYLRIHQGHFMPFSFGLVKLAVVLGSPFSWTVPAIEIIAMQTAAAFGCWWMLRTAFGNRPAILAGLGFYLFSPLTMPSIMWWAVAINQLPNQIAFFGLVGAHLRYCGSRQARWLTLAAFFLGVGYLSYAKTGLMVITVAAMTLLWFSFGPPWARFWHVIQRYRAAWTTYGGISLVWLAVYLERTPSVLSVPPSGFLPMVQSMSWQTLLPSLVGGPWKWTLFGQGPISYVLPPTIGVVTSAVVVATVIGYSWSTRHRSLQVLWMVGIYLAASAALVYSGRTVVISVLGGGFVGQHLQYLSDLAPLIAFAVVAMFVPVVGSFQPIGLRDDPIFRFRPPQWTLAALAAVFVLGSLWTSHSYAQAWRDYPDRNTTERSVDQIRELNPAFADVSVPPSVLSPIVGEQTLIKNYFAPLGNELDVRPFGSDLATLNKSGDVALAGVRTPGSPSEFADRTPVAECLDVSTIGRWWTATPPASFGLWLEIVYQSDLDTAMTIDAGGKEVVVSAKSGRHRALLATPDPGATVHVTAGSDLAGLCVTSVRYGLVAPVEGSS